MNPTDNQICQDVISALKSAKYSAINYLFLEPVDLAFFPTYTTIVKRPIDLGTVLTNLGAGVYKTKEEFCADAGLSFENAETFHKDKPENEWIVKMAKDMKKALSKEKKRYEKKYGGGGETSAKKPKLKLSIKTSEPKLKLSIKTSEQKKASPDLKTPTIGQPKVKLSLKIKQKASPAVDGSVKAQKLESAVINAAPVASTSQTPQPTKPKKPKLKLKLSSKKPPLAATAAATAAATIVVPSQNTPKTTTPKQAENLPTPKSASTPKATASTPSRGKELPTAVAEAKAAKKAESKKVSSAKKAESKTAAVKDAVSKTPAIKVFKAETKTAAVKDAGSKTPATKVLKAEPKTAASNASAAKTPSAQPKGKESGKSKGKAAATTNKKIKLSVSGSNKNNVGGGAMTPKLKAQCYKVISALKRKEHLEIGWFLKPVTRNDPRLIDEYKGKIPNAMDLGTIISK